MPQSPKKILIIEDEKSIARTLKLKLARVGFDVKTADEGAQALTALEKETFDLILLDLMLPDMDGFSILNELRARHITAPVIVSSALGQEEDIQRAITLGARDYFIKSTTSMSEIVDHINQVLNL